jgi:hypothetical protein
MLPSVAVTSDQDRPPLAVPSGRRARRVLDEEGDQLLAAGWQGQEGLAQSGLPFGREQFEQGKGANIAQIPRW